MSIIGYWRSISADGSPTDVGSLDVPSTDCPSSRALVELASHRERGKGSILFILFESGRSKVSTA